MSMSAVGISKLEDNEDALTEILLRLPVKSALRVRAVSKHWRRVATSPYFLTAYSLRRPPEIIVFHYLDEPVVLPKSGVAVADEICAAPIVRDDDGSKVMFRHLGLNGDPGVVDCRDGLLVMSRGDDRLLVVNPATGQGAVLPSPIPSRCALLRPSGFYPHHSGEYRVLCYAEEEQKEVISAGNGNGNGNGNYYILSTGAAEARRLADAGMKCSEPPSMPGDVLLHGVLHWLILLTHPTDKSGAASDEKLVAVDKMLAFDTVSETFRLMVPPPVPTGSGGYQAPNLFEMRGELAASAVRDPPHVDVWALEDYYYGGSSRLPARERWSWRLRVTVPQVPGIYSLALTALALGVIGGDVLVVQNAGLILLYDMAAKSTRTWIDLRMWKGRSALWLPGFYRESLAPVTSPPTKV